MVILQITITLSEENNLITSVKFGSKKNQGKNKNIPENCTFNNDWQYLLGFIGSLKLYLLDITKILEQKATKSASYL